MTILLDDMRKDAFAVTADAHGAPSYSNVGEDTLRLSDDVAQSIITSSPAASDTRPLCGSYNTYEFSVYELFQEMLVSIETISRNALLSYFKDHSCYSIALAGNSTPIEPLIDRANENYHCLDAPTPPRKVITDFQALRHTLIDSYAKIASLHDREMQRHIRVDLQEMAVSLAQARLSTPPQVDRIGTVRHAFNQTLRSFGLTE